VFLLLLGIAEMLEYAAFGTILQQSVPESLIGQVAGTVYPLMTVMTLLGNGLSGVLAPLFGLTPSIVGLSLLALAVTVIAWVTLYASTRGRPTESEIGAVPALAGLSENARAWVLRRMKRERFPAGAPVIREGERGETFYIIAEGKAEVEISTEGRTTIRHLGPGDVFGEIALLKDVPRTATVSAVEPLTVYSLTREDFWELQRRSEEFKEGLLQTANARLDEDTNFKLAMAGRIG
jgi:CRP-like cAMP-binding protein